MPIPTYVIVSLAESWVMARKIGSASGSAATGLVEQVEHFIDSCIRRLPETKGEEVQRTERLLEAIAENDGRYWLSVAGYRQAADAPASVTKEAYRRAVEAQPWNKKAWLARAKYAKTVRDDLTEVTSLTYAVDTDPDDVDLIREVALVLCKYVDRRTSDLSPAQRGVFLATVRSHMERISDKLDATGLSRLAWLYLLEASGPQDEPYEQARRYVEMGLIKDPGNPHCRRLRERLSLIHR